MKGYIEITRILRKLNRCNIFIHKCDKSISYLKKQILEAKLYNFKFEYENEIKSLEKGRDNFIKIYNHCKKSL